MIELNGMAWHVTRNLFFALSRLRSPDKDRTVWIDALSINQVNIPEINVQVMRLCTIYSRASCALICLSLEDRMKDDIDESLSLLFNFAQDCVPKIQGEAIDNKRICEKFSGIDLDARLKIGLGLFFVFLLPYWMRVWVLQEIMYSRNAVLLYQSYCVSYSGFIRFLPTMIDIVNDNFQTNWEHLANDVETLLVPCGSAHRGEYLTLTDWMSFAHQRTATDPRDLIFGLYNCFSPEVRRLITVDYYKELPDILTQIMPLLFMEAKTLDIMFKRKSIFGASIDVPSWVWIPENFCVQANTQSPNRGSRYP